MSYVAKVTDADLPPDLQRSLGSRLLENYGILVVVLAMVAFLYLMQPEYFLTAQNVTNIVRQIGMNALLALGLYLVILTAGFFIFSACVWGGSALLLAPSPPVSPSPPP